MKKLLFALTLLIGGTVMALTEKERTLCDVAACTARGEKAVKMVPGSVVEIPANVEHWHGAGPKTWFSHLAIECHPDTNKNTWLEPVSDADYAAATKE